MLTCDLVTQQASLGEYTDLSVRFTKHESVTVWLISRTDSYNLSPKGLPDIRPIIYSHPTLYNCHRAFSNNSHDLSQQRRVGLSCKMIIYVYPLLNTVASTVYYRAWNIQVSENLTMFFSWESSLEWAIFSEISWFPLTGQVSVKWHLRTQVYRYTSRVCPHSDPINTQVIHQPDTHTHTCIIYV